MKKVFIMVLTIALSIMQLYAEQEVRRSSYRIIDDDGNFKNIEQLEIDGRYVYDIIENTHTVIFKRWYGGSEDGLEVVIPSTIDIDGETYKVVALGGEAGNQNEKLEKVIIPEGVTRVDGFAYCYGLKSITIPSTVSEIGETFYHFVDFLVSTYFRKRQFFVNFC